jgi:hypothetical protein
MALSLTTTVGGSPTQVDKRAALYAINQENNRRAAENPLGTPLAKSTNAQIAASYKTILDEVLTDVHSHNLNQANEAERSATATAYNNATDEVQAQIRSLLGL